MKENFFSELFFSSKRFMSKLQPRLDDLENQISSIEEGDNKIITLINFLNIISKLQDEGGFSKEIEILSNHENWKTKEHLFALKSLQGCIEKVGRDLYGMNATQKGEIVSSGNVFLGGIMDVKKNSAKYFLENRDQLEKEFTNLGEKLQNPVSIWWIINEYQCKNFLKDNINCIKRQIEVLRDF